MKKKFQSSSLIEMVVAISIISICIGISSLIFIRTTKTYTSFENSQKQTEIESSIWNSLYSENSISEIEGTKMEVQETDLKMKTISFKSSSGLELFKCEVDNE